MPRNGLEMLCNRPDTLRGFGCIRGVYGLESPHNSGYPGDFPYFPLTKPVSVCLGHPHGPSRLPAVSRKAFQHRVLTPRALPARLADTTLPANSPVSCLRSAVNPFRRQPPPLSPIPIVPSPAATPSGSCRFRTAASAAAPSSATAPCYARNPRSAAPAHARAAGIPD